MGESSDPPPASSTASPTLLEQIVPDYNVRNNAAVAAAGRYDSSLWKTADTGAVLDRDVFETRYKEVFNEPAQPGELLYHGAQQYGAPSEGYPKWVVGTVTSTRNPDTASTAAPTSAPTAAPSAATPSATPSNEPDVAVAVFLQAGDAAPWLMSQSVATRQADLPTETKGKQRRCSNNRTPR